MIINIYNSTVLNDAMDKLWANTAVIQGLGKGFGMLVFFTKSSFVKFQPKAFYHFSWLSRSDRLQIFFKIDVLRNFAKFTGKHLWHSLFFNIADLRPEFRKKFKNTSIICFWLSVVLDEKSSQKCLVRAHVP